MKANNVARYVAQAAIDDCAKREKKRKLREIRDLRSRREALRAEVSQ